MRKNLFFAGVALLFSLALTPASRAALLVYEGFNYALGDGANIAGAAATGTGLTGNWAVGNGAGGASSSTYSTSGLAFSSNFLPTTAGALRQTSTADGSGSGFTAAGVALNAGTATGTLWSSQLVNFSVFSTDAAAAASNRVNNQATTQPLSNNFHFRADADAGVGAAAQPGVAYDSTAAGSGFTLSTGTTYLVLSRFTNVGATLSVGSPGTADLWVFTSAAYDSWFGAGANEADLGTFAIASAQDSVTAGTFVFDNTQFAQFATSSGANPNTQTVVFDELRYGTSLGDVAAIPEPSTWALLGAGLASLLALRRTSRRNIS